MKRFEFSEIAAKLPVIFSKFKISLQEDSKKYYGKCPIHCGDNPGAINIYKNGITWICYTQHCEEKYGSNIIGLLRAILSSNSSREYGWRDTYAFIEDILDVDKQEAYVSDINDIYLENNTTTTAKFSLDCLQNLQYPCQYYIRRKYSPEILNRYNIGLCTNPQKIMYNRAIFPIFNIDQDYLIGFSGRSIFDKCHLCRQHHSVGRCPTKHFKHVKWLHSKKFSRNNTLFNLWFAKDKIRETNTAVLCEGPGDVLRFEEVGITNSVAVFGSSITDSQLSILTKLGVMKLVLCFDNDDAGRSSCKNIVNSCKQYFTIEIPRLNDYNDSNNNNNYNDIGDIPVEDVKFWDKIKIHAEN